MIIQTLLGIVVFITIAWLMSEDKRKVPWRTVLNCMLLQLALSVLLLRTKVGTAVFDGVNWTIMQLFKAVERAAAMPFGADLVKSAPFFTLVLPTIVVMSALMALLYYWGIMQRVVYGFGIVFHKLLKTSGAESLVTAANVFLGMTEALTTIRPYLPRMTRSELMLVMTAGMATVAGGQLAAYVGMLNSTFPNIAGHLVTASLLSAPAAVMFAKIMVPESGTPETAGGAKLDTSSEYKGAVHALTEGTSSAVPLVLNILFSLIVCLTLIYFGNSLWGAVCSVLEACGIHTKSFDTIQEILGYCFLPVAWLLGMSGSDLMPAGMLLGEKTLFNEFVAFGHLGEILKGAAPFDGMAPVEFSANAKIALVYSFCGFANFGSIGILVGAMGVIANKRLPEIAALGLKSMIAASLACFLTGSFAVLLS